MQSHGSSQEQLGGAARALMNPSENPNEGRAGDDPTWAFFDESTSAGWKHQYNPCGTSTGTSALGEHPNIVLKRAARSPPLRELLPHKPSSAAHTLLSNNQVPAQPQRMTYRSHLSGGSLQFLAHFIAGIFCTNMVQYIAGRVIRL